MAESSAKETKGAIHRDRVAASDEMENNDYRGDGSFRWSLGTVKDEKTWGTRPYHQVKGMAQQQARKRLKNVLGVVLLFLGVILFLSACGDESPAVPPTPTPDTTPPQAPTGLSPQEGFVTGSRMPTFDWDDVADPSGVTYTLEVHTNEEFGYPVIVKEGLTESQYALQPGESLPDGNYWWRVRAVDGAGNESPWAHPGITVDTQPPPAPQTLSPRTGEMVLASTLSLDWSDVVDPSGVSYTLEIHRNADFTDAVHTKEQLSASEYTLSPGETLDAGKYYWRVKAIDGAGSGSPWATSSFTVSTGPIGPYVAHTVEGRGDCLACHAFLGMWPLPTDHQDHPNQSCLNCHEPVPGGPPEIAHTLENSLLLCDSCHAGSRLAPLPVSHERRPGNTCTMCHQPGLEVPNEMPHASEGRETCTGCHASGKLAGVLDDTHEGRTDPMCLACHEESPIKATLVSHDTEGRETCSSCHEEGGMVALPDTHEGRTDPMCLACHEESPVKPARIAHSTGGDKEQCTECHAADKLVALPVTHEGRTNRMCNVCHEVSPVQPTKVAHTPEGKEACASCHADQELAGALPATHEGRTNPMCLACHEVYSRPTEMPHSPEGKEPCASCHADQELVGALPKTHEGRTEPMCLACHETIPEGVPDIPHKLEKRSDCILCHERR